MEKKDDTLVLFPVGAMGHVIPMVELAKRLLHHGLPIRVLLLRLTFLNNDPIDAYISDVKASHPSEAQMREIAVGLERSKQRFLWVVRGPPPPGGVKGDAKPWTEPDLQALMPEGFEERTRERGVLVRSWAPQVELLEHEAVGGFVTHCGWNSVLEAVVAGVAMIAWPLYAEQQMNKVFLVEAAGLAVEMRGDENGLVGAGEVEERVRWLMEAECGRELRRKVAAVGKEARDAVRDGGTSHAAMAEMLRALRGDEDGAREACNCNGRE